MGGWGGMLGGGWGIVRVVLVCWRWVGVGKEDGGLRGRL